MRSSSMIHLPAPLKWNNRRRVSSVKRLIAVRTDRYRPLDVIDTPVGVLMPRWLIRLCSRGSRAEVHVVSPGSDRREVWADLVYAPDEVTRTLSALAERYRAEAEQDQRRNPYAGGGR